MLTERSLVEFAEIEYRRDGDFRKLVDSSVAEMQQAGVVRPGQSLAEIFGLRTQDGVLLARVLLTAFHDRAILPQWRRVLQLQGAA
jgi:hypothetical protein